MRQRERSTRGEIEMRILVADDDFHSREGLRLFLLGEGYAVETARNGWQALQRLKEGPFELAIIDLPAVHGVTLNGWNVLRLCRAYCPAISILVVSAQAGRELRARAEQVNVSVFLKKPVDRMQLKAIVRTRLRQLGGVQRKGGWREDENARAPDSRVAPTPIGYAGLTDQQQRALFDGAIGAGGGAVLGAITGGSPVIGAAVGGAAGVVGGLLIHENEKAQAQSNSSGP